MERLRYLDLTLNDALSRAVQAWPDHVFLRMDQKDVTFRQFDIDVGRLAAGLASLGVGLGDRVCVFMRNSIECEHTWFATNRLGAVWTPINTDFRGVGLRSVIEIARPKLLITDVDLCADLLNAFPAGLNVPIVVAGHGKAPGST